jgi:hypothetical protein
MQLRSRQLFKPISCLIIGAIVVALLIFPVINRAGIENELVALDLLPKPEKMTELYFTENASLPSSATSNRVIRFAFVIHNLETTDYKYDYEVSVNVNSTRQIVNSGKVSVKNNKYYVKSEQFNLMNSSGRQEVVVELINLHQSIDFWIGNG